MDKKTQRVLAVNLDVNRVVENRRREAACVENTGWTDAAREVSLRVRQNNARVRELMKDKPDGSTYSDASGTWRKYGDDVELVRVSGMYAAGQNNGRFITELAAGRPGDFFDPYSKGTINAMEHYGYITPAQGAAARAYYGYGDVRNRDRAGRACVENIGWTDEARAASLAVRRGMAASRQLGAPAKGGKGGGAPVTPPTKPMRYGIRAPDPEDEAKLGNPNTEYEGERIVAYGHVFEVQNGVLRRVGSYPGGGFSYGGVVRRSSGAGADGAVGARVFESVLKKMSDAGVDVYNGLGSMTPWMRKYYEKKYGRPGRDRIRY